MDDSLTRLAFRVQGGDVDAARAEFEAGRRPEFDIVADITNAAGATTSRLTARWTLKAILRTP